MDHLDVPSVWLAPTGAAPAPAALLLHGFSSSKERMAQSVGRALLARGVDATRLGIVGYSLGGFLALMTAADDERLRVVALAAAGDLPDHTPYASLIRGLVNPLRAAERLGGRPLLLVNGRGDTTTRPAQAQRLFDAAREPKTMHWYDGGHWPPAPAIESAARWTAERLHDLGAARSARPRRTG